MQTGASPIGQDAVFIDSGGIVGDKLLLNVSYSGGCVPDHALQLDWDGTLLKTNPPRASLTLSHDAFGDPCEALISEEATFDLSTSGLLDSDVNVLLVEGTNTIAVPVVGPSGTPGCPDHYLHLEDWNAFDNRMPPGRSFYVSGTVVAPTGGYTGSLAKAVPQGINPSILLLDLKVEKPTGPATDATQHVPVRYDEPHYGGGYSSVQVRCGSTVVQNLDIKTVW